MPLVSLLMALAAHFDRLIRKGKAREPSELARLSHITQPRMSQIINLIHLALDTKEQLLFLQAVTAG